MTGPFVVLVLLGVVALILEIARPGPIRHDHEHDEQG